jgi:succinate dehydrogenase/fumarate reductase cytochrome b subunit
MAPQDRRMSSRTNPLLLRAAAPLAALAYPALIWCGPRVSPLFLGLALVVPLVGWRAADRLAAGDPFPIARVVAHLAVAAPALYSLLGGWLDFQRAVPLSSAGVWVPLWLVSLAASLRDRPRLTPRPPHGSTLTIAHGVSAALILVFATAHLTNHLAGLFGGEAHRAVMDRLRLVYRDAWIEPLLLGVVAFQAASGMVLLGRALARRRSRLETLQSVSGAYLLLFFASHLSAVLRAHGRGRDTDWGWLAGGELLTDPWSARLVPYYFLGVIALGVHGACGLRRVLERHGLAPPRGRALVAAIAVLATAVSAAIQVGLFRA